MEFSVKYQIDDTVYYKSKQFGFDVGLITAIQITRKYYGVGNPEDASTHIAYQVDESTEWHKEENLYPNTEQLTASIIKTIEHYEDIFNRRLEARKANRCE